jgi:hypothetical protein
MVYFMFIGDVDAAQSTLQHCIDVEPTYSDGHILMAQIHLQQNNFKLANQSLEVGLSHNFEVKSSFCLYCTYSKLHIISEHGYSKLPVISNNLFWPEFCPSLFNIKNIRYSEHCYKELSLIRNSFLSPNSVKSTENYTFIANSKISAIRKYIPHFHIIKLSIT